MNALVNAALIDLRSKYVEMRDLRSSPVADPRPRLAALASRFPGALREIDDLPLSEIDRRIDALSLAETKPNEAKDWMHAMVRFHALARGVLFAKRSLAEEPEGGAVWPDEARVWTDDLARVARPPRGRVMDLVYERLGGELGMPPHVAKELVFGRSRRARLSLTLR
jgi:hypothetical protein